MSPACPLPEVPVVLRLKTDITASGDRFLNSALHETDSHLLYCILGWSYETSNNCIAKYHKIISHPVDQL